jgi:5-methylcytosine-specific restriction endonuclease McrA
MSRGSTRRYRRNRAAVLAFATHCWICGKPGQPGDPLVTDHVVPRSKGGHDGPGNLRPAHRSCNGKKSNHWPPDPATPATPRVRNPPLADGAPEPTARTHPHLVIEVDPETGEKYWWPAHSRDW